MAGSHDVTDPAVQALITDGEWHPDQGDLRAAACPGGAAVMRAESAFRHGITFGITR